MTLKAGGKWKNAWVRVPVLRVSNHFSWIFALLCIMAKWERI